jgi:hypothetical protein
MEGRESPARRDGLPWGLVGMLALVVSIERYVARHPDDFTRTDPANWRFSARAARGAEAKADILCLGDSLVKFGVQARVVAHATGRRAVNLAVFGGHMPATYFVLEHALRAGARPEAILVDCQDGPIPRVHRRDRPDGLQVNMRSWPELLTASDCFDLSCTARDAGFFAEVMLAKALPSYKARSEIRDAFASAMRGRGDSWFVTVRALRRNWAQNQGTHVAPHRPAPPAAPASEGARPRPREFPGETFARNELTLSYAARLLDLAAAHKIAVFWLLPPVGPGKQAERDGDGIDSYHTRQARWALSRSGGVVVIDGRRSGYGPGVFADKVHLDSQGGATFSADVAAIVRRRLDNPSVAPRWVELPPYRDVETGVPVEDFAESRHALRAGRAVRR